jgi:NAD(P)-dependent dehydrogenase (short-subunit alcohol dehydrogenase family)
VVTARDEAAAASAAEELGGAGGEALAHQLDVTDEASVAALASALERDPGRLDALVNNAGVTDSYHPGAAEIDLDDAKEVLETNLWGAWRLTQSVLPLLQASGHGRIVNVSSGMGQLVDMHGGSPGYRTSKLALNGLTRMLADELAEDGILVNSLCPGWVRTDMGGRSAPRSVEEGADTAVWLATLPDDGPTGGFFRNREPIPW